MVYKCSSALIKRMNRAIHNFVWSSLMDAHKVINVSWYKCSLLVKNGDLGIKSHRLLNKSCSVKRAWKFIFVSTFFFDFHCLRYLPISKRNYTSYITPSMLLGLKEMYLALCSEVIGWSVLIVRCDFGMIIERQSH